MLLLCLVYKGYCWVKYLSTIAIICLIDNNMITIKTSLEKRITFASPPLLSILPNPLLVSGKLDPISDGQGCEAEPGHIVNSL